jgi:hypothetical protein
MGTFDHLQDAFRRALQEQPVNLSHAIHALPAVGHLPSPWTTWTLIGLVRHRRRQLWVGEVVATRLGGDREVIAVMGALGHPPEMPQQGLVPGLTEWEYYFHGIGCCLTHRGTGEAIDVDFFGPVAEYFVTFFYTNYLKSLKEPEPAEARLIALHPSSEPLRLATEDLLDAGMLRPMEGRDGHPFRVADEVLDHEREIDEFCEAWENPDRRPWLAAAIGDWPEAHEQALSSGDRGLIDATAERASDCKDMRSRELLARWADEPKRGNVLLALDDLDADVLEGLLERALKEPIANATSRAVDIIERRDAPAWCPAIRGLFRRLDPSRALIEAYLWSRCLRFLFRHNYLAEEMKAALPRAEGIAIGEAALLALEHDPDRSLPLFRRALRSNIPANRSIAAATLALIDRTWSRRELMTVLHKSDDQEATSECRAALMECHNQAAHLTVEAWERANPHEPEPGPWISMGEMSLRNRPAWLRFEMENLHDRVIKIRHREPGDVGSRWSGTLRRVTSWLSKKMGNVGRLTG